MEAYTRWQASAPWSVLSKSGLLSERERLPTVSLVFILSRRGYRSQRGTFQLKVGQNATQQVWFREVCLWRIKPDASWQNAPALMPLLPLTDHGMRRRDVVRHATDVITSQVADTVIQGDLLGTLAIFANLVYPGMNVIDMIGREKMKHTRFYRDVFAEGRLETKRSDILEILEARFGPEAAEEFRELIQQIEDVEQLSALHRLAATCRSVAQYRREFASATAAAN